MGEEGRNLDQAGSTNNGASNRLQIAAKGGAPNSWFRDLANAASSFQINVVAAGVTNKTVKWPKNFTLKPPWPWIPLWTYKDCQRRGQVWDETPIRIKVRVKAEIGEKTGPKVLCSVRIMPSVGVRQCQVGS
ncbi:hypothetical protein L484_012680 [Morus notabilis]|uniref:Uncharacterized protein n=1 Tax=Morus notabilis TaxID=981085 RepID=W9QK40_9ROSA|nr:hypothetical protein L484_012680 [Morus notabilis]